MRPLVPAMVGVWPSPGFYPASVVIDGALFALTPYAAPYPGVVAQYRESIPRNSRHLKIDTDGVWSIDHLDSFNPDFGQPLQHLFADVLKVGAQ